MEVEVGHRKRQQKVLGGEVQAQIPAGEAKAHVVANETIHLGRDDGRKGSECCSNARLQFRDRRGR